MRLLHIKRRTRQLAVQQIPLVALLILGHQPAILQLHTLAVFRHRQLRASHQHQRVILQLFAADAGEGGVELREDPLRLGFAVVLQAGAGGIVNQSVAVLPEKSAPGLLAGGIHRALHRRQRVGVLQQPEPLAGHLRVGLLAGADQPHQLPVKALHKALIEARRNGAKRLFRQHRQHAAVHPRLRQQRQQHAQHHQAGEPPQQREASAVTVQQIVGVRHRSVALA
nr:Uncharacterised protein [Raoultella sp. NCTC 9187]